MRGIVAVRPSLLNRCQSPRRRGKHRAVVHVALLPIPDEEKIRERNSEATPKVG